MKKRLNKFAGLMVIVFVVIVGSLVVAPLSAQAAYIPGEYCETYFGGTWIGSTPFELGENCIDAPDNTNMCGAPGYLKNWNYFGSAGWAAYPSSCHLPPAPDADPAPNYGMERKGYCKLVSIEETSLGGTVTAVVKGKPSTLKLKADGKTYSLPVVPGSLLANGDGTHTAQFYTIDPVTGQALVPAGEYTARCHGANGSNDGGSANRVTIGY